MTTCSTRRSFLGSASLAALGLPLAEALAQTAQAQAAATAESFQVFTAGDLDSTEAKLKSTPGDANLYHPPSLPFTIVMTVEKKKAAAEFEWHEGRDHIFQVIEGATTYELGGTPQGKRNLKPAEWRSTSSDGAKTVHLKKGDLLVIPRGTPHKRTTDDSVTFYLISVEGSMS